MKIFKYALLAIPFLYFSCNDDDDIPEPINEEEVITTMTVTLAAHDGSGVVIMQTYDQDGEGPVEPVVTVSGPLSSATSYSGSIQWLNELEDPAEDITEEILEEADEHQVFFEFTEDIFTDPLGVGNIGDVDGKVNYNDYDDNENPLGLSTTWTTSAESFQEGTFRVMLMHQPGSKSDTSTSEDGDADFDLEFVININGSSIVAIGTSSNLQ